MKLYDVKMKLSLSVGEVGFGVLSTVLENNIIRWSKVRVRNR